MPMMFSPQIQKVIDRVDLIRREVDDHWQIPGDEAMVLAQLVRAGRCRSVCEIGTSYGFSTLHLTAAAAGPGAEQNGGRDGHVHAIEPDPRKVDLTRRHLEEAGLTDAATLHDGRAQDVLPELKPAAPFDFVFFDAVKAECFEYLQHVTPHLADHCILATDNTDTHWDELAEFVTHLRGTEGATSCNVAVGNGFELTVLQR